MSQAAFASTRGSAWLCVAPPLGFCSLGEAQRLPWSPGVGELVVAFM